MRESVMNRLIEYLDILEANETISGTVLIKYRGDIVLHKGYGWADREEMIPNQPGTKFLIGSISKQFTAMAILQLWEKNRVALDETIDRYFPRFPYSNHITLHDLLTHQSGIRNFIFHEQFASLSQQSIKLDELINVISELPFVFEPKSRFEYTNSGYALLASVVEQVSGYPFADYLNQYIFAPLGMKDTGYFEPDQMISNRAKGYALKGDELVPSRLLHPSWFQGSASMTSTTTDLERWVQALYTDAIGSKETVAHLYKPYIRSPKNRRLYGYGLTILDDFFEVRGKLIPTIQHGGTMAGFESNIMHVPQDGIAIIALGNTNVGSPEWISFKLLRILYDDARFSMPARYREIELDPAWNEALLGNFEAEAFSNLGIITKNHQLFLRGYSHESMAKFGFRLIPQEVSDSMVKFIIKYSGGNVVVSKELNGELSLEFQICMNTKWHQARRNMPTATDVR